MEHLLHNPVYHALCTGDARFNMGTDAVKFFDEEVSPFAGFNQYVDKGFDELHHLLPPQRKILYATRLLIKEPKGWELLQELSGIQFVYNEKKEVRSLSLTLDALNHQHVEQMVALAALTKPGPFNSRTIEFGNYFGIFDKEKLVAMTGQRLHVGNYTEISAVCTHPTYLGRGFAAALMHHQLALILNAGQTPFLHVRADNSRAISLYERLGFKVNGPMNFYFLMRK